jgi:FeS assembly SUF system protein
MYHHIEDDNDELEAPYVDGTCPSPKESEVMDAIRGIYDPEIPVNIVEMGLIYNLEIDDDDRSAKVTMTLTAPGCPVAEEMPIWVQNAVTSVDGIDRAEVKITWEPFWRPDFMTEAARLETGFF